MNKADFQRLPIGYKYCMDCFGFTPHTKINQNGNDVFICDVCTNEIVWYNNPCDLCGYIFGTEEIYEPDYHEEIIHGEGCHLNTNLFDYTLRSFVDSLSYEDRFKLSNKIRYEESIECGCKSVVIFHNNHRVAYRSWSVYSMDCMNATEWEVTMKCPICGELSIFSDGSC